MRFEVEILQQLFEFFTDLIFALLTVLEEKVFARHAAQDHAFQPVQIIETITGGFLHRRQQGCAGILTHQARAVGARQA